MRSLAFAALLSFGAMHAVAGPDDFSTGPVIEDFGPAAIVKEAQAIPADAHFKIAFDADSDSDDLNRTLVSAARFLNMQGQAGIDPSRIDLAIIVHGGAIMDILSDEAHAAKKNGVRNPNTPLVAALRDQGVKIILCGQTSAYRGVSQSELLLGVDIAVSAMTAHALLQQDGYTLYPF